LAAASNAGGIASPDRECDNSRGCPIRSSRPAPESRGLDSFGEGDISGEAGASSRSGEEVVSVSGVTRSDDASHRTGGAGLLFPDKATFAFLGGFVATNQRVTVGLRSGEDIRGQQFAAELQTEVVIDIRVEH